MKKKVNRLKSILLILVMILATSLPMMGCHSLSNQGGSQDRTESSDSKSDKKDKADDSDQTEDKESEEQGGVLENGGDLEIIVPEGQETLGE